MDVAAILNSTDVVSIRVEYAYVLRKSDVDEPSCL
jgi:hypothetical protein